jgi:hypothetical protein
VSNWNEPDPYSLFFCLWYFFFFRYVTCDIFISGAGFGEWAVVWTNAVRVHTDRVSTQAKKKHIKTTVRYVYLDGVPGGGVVSYVLRYFVTTHLLNE